MSVFLMGIAAFVGVAALVGGAALLLYGKPARKIEDRLDLLTGVAAPSKDAAKEAASILASPLDDAGGVAEMILERFGNVGLLFEQADANLTVPKFLAISAATAAGGAVLGVVLQVHLALLPAIVLLFGALPLGWLLLRRKRRLKAFGAQLPDALEMIARSLRAGQSLAFGFNMVASEMPPPLGREFGRVFEEQNLGIPLDDSLHALTDRIPNLDLKFFVTALILQRQTGGDLAEILDKIAALIRDRFRIWGQIQALTGEGRLSGIVLLALPFALFAAVYQLNREYVMTLFTDDMGKKMLLVAVVMQIFGALVIRKIVNIKV